MRSIASAILAMACGTGVFAQTSASWTTAFAIDNDSLGTRADDILISIQ